jgi:hypothetical protein
MKLKNRDELLNDVIKQGKKHPTGWMASFGKNTHHLSQDCYLLHPNIGLFYLKEFQKNPFQQIGVGGKIARKIDDDLTEELRKESQDFGIIQGDIKRIASNMKKGISPHDIIQGMFKGENKGMSMPVKGKATNSPDANPKFKDHGKQNQKKINTQFKKLAGDEGLYSSYR